MQRILVIGCCGAGKSTFSKKLQSILKLELIHLDQYYHKPNWEEPKKGEWDKIVNSLLQKPSWIMDGTYNRTMDVRIKSADTIIYLIRLSYRKMFLARHYKDIQASWGYEIRYG